MQGNPWLLIAAALPLAGAVPAYVLGRRQARYAFVCMMIASAATFAVLTVLLVQTMRGQTLTFVWADACVMGLSLAADGFRAMYAWIAALMWLATTGFSFGYFRHKHSVPRYAFFTLVTLSAVVGVFLSDQLLTTIVFFEVMGLCSYPWVAHEETPQAMRAAQSYLWITVIGGLCLLLGMLLLPPELITAKFSAGFAAADYPAESLVLPAVLMLVGFGAKAGAFPLHVWLPKAHPVAPAPASALLSGMLLKTGVFGILLLSVKFLWQVPAWHVLIFWIGVVTMALGALLALFAVEMKRILACSSMSQIGFILLGVGLFGLLGDQGAVAAQGAVTHMVNHSLFKLILFLSAGVVAMHTHSLHLNDIRGFGRGKPMLHFIFLSGMLGITGVPLWSGFASKSLLHEGLTEYIGMLQGNAGLYTAAEWLFLLSGGLTVAYMLKLYICLFWERPAKAAAEKKPVLSRGSAVMLCGFAAVPWAFGLMPSVFMTEIGVLSEGFLQTEAESVRYFTAENLLGAGKSIGIGLVVYGLVVRGWISQKAEGVRRTIDRWPAWLDLETMVYRPVLKALLAVVSAVCWAASSLPEAVITGVRRVILHVRAWRVPMPGSNRFTTALGGLLNGIKSLLNKTVRKSHPVDIDFACALAATNEEVNQSMRRLKRSMSYSLLLVCIGLFLLLGYLVLW